jgi:hypothetical protein
VVTLLLIARFFAYAQNDKKKKHRNDGKGGNKKQKGGINIPPYITLFSPIQNNPLIFFQQLKQPINIFPTLVF